MNEDRKAGPLRVARATPGDSGEIWQWRNDPLTRRMSISTDEVSQEAHDQWFARALDNPDCYLFIGSTLENDKIGVCRFDIDRVAGVAEVSINLNPQWRHRHLAHPFLARCIKAFLQLEQCNLRATIRPDNIASIKVFEKCGFAVQSRDEGLLYLARAQAALSFRFIANASGVFTGKHGTEILCDPWLVDGVFEGSWCHYPKLRTTNRDLDTVDAIYVSHLHPDHFDERHFDFDKSIPLIVLDHGPNFLIKKLTASGYSNFIRIKSGETVRFREFELTMFAPFAKHNFHEATVGNLIDSALLVSCDGVSALNANDNTPALDSAAMLAEKYGPITLAMLNYNAAGPYPSCFDNLTDEQKVAEHQRVLTRNFEHMRNVLAAMQPRFVLPFAGAYVLGGDLGYKNKYLGTTTWDECGRWLEDKGIGATKVVLLSENDTLDVAGGTANRAYVPLDVADMQRYIKEDLASVTYPHQHDPVPDRAQLLADIETAAAGMHERMKRFGIASTFSVVLEVFGQRYQIYPSFGAVGPGGAGDKVLKCKLDERLLRRILNRKASWNNAEIGAHISLHRSPNTYEPDLHTGLQFFHL